MGTRLAYQAIYFHLQSARSIFDRALYLSDSTIKLIFDAFSGFKPIIVYLKFALWGVNPLTTSDQHLQAQLFYRKPLSMVNFRLTVLRS